MQQWYRYLFAGFGLWTTAGTALAGGPAPVYVGVGAGCQHVSLIAALAAVPDGGEIRIASTGVSIGATLQLSGRQVRIAGGYGSCTASESTGKTTIQPQFSGGPLLAISNLGPSSFDVELVNLDLTGASNPSAGGAIQTAGPGTLVLTNTHVYGNQAQDGGGLYVAGSSPMQTSVVLRRGSRIGGPGPFNNVATGDGGGLYCSQARVYLGDVEFDSNVAAADGGGMALVGCEVQTLDEPGTTSIQANNARDGGGIHASAGSTLLLASTPSRKVVIAANKAIEGAPPQRGGGIYLHGEGTRLVGAGVWIIENRAVLGGGALFMTQGALATLNRGTDACTIGDDRCVRLDGNIAGSETAVGGNGGVAQVLAGAQLALAHVRIQANSAGNNALFRVNGLGSRVSLDNALMVGNQTIGRLLTVENSGTLDIDFTTMADNQFNGGALENLAGTSVALQRSILQVPSGLAVVLGAGTVTAACVNTTAGALAGDAHEPGFVDVASGNYRLRSDSQNLDRCTADGNESATDISGRRRNIDRPQVPNNIGPLDRGAFEDVDELLRDGFES